MAKRLTLFFLATSLVAACSRPDGDGSDDITCPSAECDPIEDTNGGNPGNGTGELTEVHILITSAYQPIPPDCVDLMDKDSFTACADAHRREETVPFTIDGDGPTGTTGEELVVDLDLSVDHYVYLGLMSDAVSVIGVTYDEDQYLYIPVIDDKHPDGVYTLPLNPLDTEGGGWTVAPPTKLVCEKLEDGTTHCIASAVLARYYDGAESWHCQTEDADGNVSALTDGTMLSTLNVDSMAIQTHVVGHSDNNGYRGSQGTFRTTGDLMASGFDGFDLMGLAAADEVAISVNNMTLPPTATRCTIPHQ